MIKILCFIFIMVLLGFPANADDTDGFVGSFLANYITSFYNTGNNNFPSDEANAVLQTRDGFMWFGTYSGLIRYDSRRFTVWDAVSQDGFNSSNIRSLYEDGSSLWIGTNDRGLVRYKNGSFTNFDRVMGTPSNMIRAIVSTSDGKIFGGTPEGLFHVDTQEIITIVSLDTDIQPFIVSLNSDKQDNVYMIFNSGELFVYTPEGRTVLYPYASRFRRVKLASGDRIIAGGQDGIIHITSFNGQNFNPPAQKQTPLLNVSDIYEDSRGFIWITAENGIGFLDANEDYHHVGNPNGVGFYTDIWEDYQNGYWISASRGGIVKLTLSSFTDFNALYNFQTGTANAIVIHGGLTYIGTNDGLYILDENGMPTRTDFTESININSRVRGISVDNNGYVWISTYSSFGTIRYNPETGEYRYWTPMDGLASERTRLKAELPNGVIVIGTTAGVDFIQGNRVISVNEAFDTDISLDLPDITVLSLSVTADGTLYIGTDGNGVYAVNSSGTTRFREEDGLTGGVVLRMAVNPKTNGVWVSAAGGLNYIDENKKVKTIEKVPPFTFFDILQYNNDLVLMTSSTIIRTDADALLDPDLPFEHIAIGRASGLNTSIVANAWNLISPEGRLYFCSDSGIFIYDFETALSPLIPFAGINKVTIDDKEYTDISKIISIPQGMYRLTIELSYLSFGLSDDATMYYTLIGQDNRAQLMMKDGSLEVSYTNLRGGNYTFRVWTEDPAGNMGNLIELNLYKELKLLEHPVFLWIIALFTVILIVLSFLLIDRYRSKKYFAKQHEYDQAQKLKLEALEARYDKEKAEAASKAKSDFLASMSHEIRTPMNAITGMAELLLRRDLSEEARSEAQDIKQAATSLITIINDILDFSKIEAGKLDILNARYVLSSLVNNMANIIRMRLMEKSVEFIINIDSNIPDNLFGDEVRLRQIMINLLSNAAKFTNQGHISLAISRLLPDDEHLLDTIIWLEIVINDTGHGIKPEDLEKLFLDFTQIDTKKNRGIEGTGLGLVITKRLCEAMGGKISVESEYGKGSKFTVIIPQELDLDALQPPDTKRPLDAPFEAAGDLNGIFNKFTIPHARILVVDDIATNLKVAEGQLAPYLSKVDTCLSGAEAIKLVKQNNYDMIFMDHMMPEMDGIETTAAIRTLEEEHFKTMPIIALTANAVSGMREMFIEKGFNDFLAKPIDVSKLDEMLDLWIKKEKREREHKKKLVLLVDDNPANLKLGISVLEEKYDVITAPSAEKMHKLLENNSPDLIILGTLDSGIYPPVIDKWSDKVVLISEPLDPVLLIANIDTYFIEV